MILSAWVSDSDPPKTVKSLANTNTVRPFTVPQPVLPTVVVTGVATGASYLAVVGALALG